MKKNKQILVSSFIIVFVLSTLLAHATDASYFIYKANQAYKSGNYSTAAKLYKKACDGGESSGCINLGIMYDKGKGVKQDYLTAAKLYKKACNGGDAFGCYNLGLLYVYGRGVKQNKIKAYHYWMKAARRGITEAQHNLDILCRQSPWVCK